MRVSHIHAGSALLLLCVLSSPAQDTRPAKDPLAREMMGDAMSAGKKFVSLLEALPDDELDWRPAAGVRSFRELFTHIADANHFFMTFVGGPGAGDPDLPKDQAARENRFKAKADLLKHLTLSFEHTSQMLGSLGADELAKDLKMFGRQTTGRGAMLVNLGHIHEHLGQAIAYARMNGVTPPWSQSD